MPYATPTAYLTRFGLDEAVMLLADEEKLLTATLLKDAIAVAAGGTWTGTPTAEQQAAGVAALARLTRQLAVDSNYMDGYLRSAVTLPLSAEDANAGALEDCCVALTRFGIADDTENTTDRTDKTAETWRTWLKDIARGTVQLVGPGGDEVANTGTVRSGQAVSGYRWDLFGGVVR